METPSTGNLLTEGQRLISSAPFESGAYVLLTALASSLADVPGWEGPGVFASTAASLGLGYLLVVAMVEKGGLSEGNRARFWPYFGLGLLMSIGIGLASILLIVPGIFLWVRWSAAYGFLAAEGTGAAEAMTQSFDITRGIAWASFGALVIPLAIFVFAVVSTGYLTWESEVPAWPVSLAANLAISLAGLLTTGIGLAVYSLRRDRVQGLDEVFA